MAGILLYQSGPKWRIVAALGVAVLIHFAAVALANIHRSEQINEFRSSNDGFPPIELTTEASTDNPTLPPDVVDSEPSPNPTDDSFRDVRPSPPPIHRHDNRLVVPIAKPRNGSPGSLTLSSASVLALNAPRPEYPYEAKRQKITGSGIVVMRVDPGSGGVKDVSMWQSTGSPVLDNATVAAFRRWRFKPGTASRVKAPITFTMTGPQY